MQTVRLTQSLADPVELATLHMVNTDPNRTPTFVMFENPDFFFNESNCSGVPQCASPGFAWNHGDIQQEIGNTWVGFVGPGVASNGIDSTTGRITPTSGQRSWPWPALKDDYEQDGHVLVQALTDRSAPPAFRDQGPDTSVAQLEQEEDLLNAPFGTFAKATLAASTFALESTNESVYKSIEDQIGAVTSDRDKLAAAIRDELYQAAVNGHPIDRHQAQTQIAQATALIAQAAALPSG